MTSSAKKIDRKLVRLTQPDYSESMLIAISKAQAIIEFNLDGTIMTANENFLKTLGYDLNEMHGKHHKMFCDPNYTNSFEYRA